MKTLKTMILSAGAAMTLRTALLAASLVASAAGQTLIGIDYVSATGQDEIRTVNPNTGETTLLNSFKFDSGYWVSGTVVANRAAGKLYVESSTPTLYTFGLLGGQILSTVPLDTSMDVLALDN